MWIINVKNAQQKEHCRTFLKPGVPVTIGRAPDSTIFLSAQAVSRTQGRIEIRKDLPVYFDDETSTGARVDGHYVRGPTPLSEKNVLEIGGFLISVERDPHAKPPRKAAAEPAKPAAPTGGDWTAPADAPLDDIEAMMARRIQGIRQHRDQHQQDAKARTSQVETEWTQLLESVRKFQQKLAGDPRVQSFAVSRDQKEILFKVADRGAPRGYSQMIVARRHPEGKYPDLDGAWLLELGQQDAFYPSPKSAMEEFVHRIAPKLA